jgi:branched-chain amino acid transport system permease protein
LRLKQSITTILHSKRFLITIAIFFILALIPVLINDNFFLTVITLITIFAIYAASWNFLANTGQGSLGHALFLGIGGFASAIIGSSVSTAIISFLGLAQIPIGALSVTILVMALLAGSLFSAGVGLLIGLACVRLKAWYLAMVTFGFSVIAATLSSQFDAVTHGINGFTTVTLVPKGFPFYILAISFAIISISIMYLIMKSRIGLAFKAVHGNENEAKMIGINTSKYKLLAFVISTFFAGLSGGLYAYFIRLIDNSIFSPANSFTPLIMTVIGGLGTVAGPIIGAIFLVAVQQILALPNVVEFLRTSLGSYFPEVSNVGPPLSYLAIGVILVVIVIFAPKGLEPQFHKLYNYLASILQEKEKTNEGK